MVVDEGAAQKESRMKNLIVLIFGYDVSGRATERASERPYRLGGRGVSRYSSRSPIRETRECHISLAVFCLEKSEKHSFLFAMSTNDRRG